MTSTWSVNVLRSLFLYNILNGRSTYCGVHCNKNTSHSLRMFWLEYIICLKLYLIYQILHTLTSCLVKKYNNLSVLHRNDRQQQNGNPNNQQVEFITCLAPSYRGSNPIGPTRDSTYYNTIDGDPIVSRNTEV